MDGGGPACTSGPENTAAACGDGCDNDGDSLSDCADSDCLGVGSCHECAPGDMDTECGPTTETGACVFGTRFCGTAGAWGECGGAVLPTAEVCNGGSSEQDDEDCDGLVDEGCDCTNGETRGCHFERTTPPIVTGGASRCTAVIQTCVDGRWPRDCSAEGFVGPIAEVCDGANDEDCDGVVDNGCSCAPNGSSRSCGTDTGRCTVGTETCTAGMWGACSGTGPIAETCNGADDDCDGRIDEGVRNACGTCGAVPTEVCDGADNDCDGTVDEGLPRPTTPDSREPNNTWAAAHRLASGPALAPSGGSGAPVSAGAVSFHDGDPADYYTWWRAYSTWDNTYTQRFMCRISGLTAAQRAELRIGVFVPGGGSGFNQASCDVNLNCFHYRTICSSLRNNEVCAVSIPAGVATAGSSEYVFGAGVIPGAGWSTCDVDYTLECRMTTFTTW